MLNAISQELQLVLVHMDISMHILLMLWIQLTQNKLLVLMLLILGTCVRVCVCVCGKACLDSSVINVIKGPTWLMKLNCYNIIAGTVIDYMYCTCWV